jgi:hypothetical protein
MVKCGVLFEVRTGFLSASQGYWTVWLVAMAYTTWKYKSAETRLLPERLGFDSRQRQIFLFFSIVSRLALNRTKPSTQCERGGYIFPWVSRRGVKLTTHFDLTPRLRKRGGLPPRQCLHAGTLRMVGEHTPVVKTMLEATLTDDDTVRSCCSPFEVSGLKRQ